MCPKVLVFGIDGATFDVVNPLIAQGYLPTLARLMQTGVRGALESTFPPLTSPAWISFATGKHPDNLGVYDLMVRKPNSYETIPVDSGSFSARSLWDILSDYDKRSILVNIPATYPPHEINGLMVTGVFTPSKMSGYTYPRQLKSQIERLSGGYEFAPARNVEDWDERGLEQFLEDIHRITDKQTRVIRHLISQEKWDLFALNLMAADWVQHFTWKYMDKKHPLYTDEGNRKFGDEIRICYQKLDTILAELLEGLSPNTNVFVISDHGFGKTKACFNINDWLMAEGYLHLRQYRKGKPPLARLGLTREKAKELFSKSDLLYAAVQQLPRRLRSFLPTGETYPRFEANNVDWSKTRAYSNSGQGQIRINLRDRDPMGVVRLSDYEDLQDEIIQGLKQIRDPYSGEPLTIQTYKLRELYSGTEADGAPDIQIVIGDREYGFQCSLGHESFFDLSPGFTADHRMEGVFIAHGPDIAAAAEIKDARLIDIAPTILHLLGMPIPADMDGQVLVEAFKGNSDAAKKDIEYQETTGIPSKKNFQTEEDDNTEVKERLSDLGYLD